MLYQSGKEPGLVFNRPDCVGKLTHRIQSSFEGKLDSISQGSVLPNPPNAWRWTRKVAGKTVSVGLSPQKALLMIKAIENQRSMDQIIDEMRAITQRLILDDPLPAKAKPKKS